MQKTKNKMQKTENKKQAPREKGRTQTINSDNILFDLFILNKLCIYDFNQNLLPDFIPLTFVDFLFFSEPVASRLSEAIASSVPSVRSCNWVFNVFLMLTICKINKIYFIKFY